MAFDSWAVVELFGHQIIAGRVTEETIGGIPFLRVDVPEQDDQEDQPAFTKFYGNGAIYSMTPCSEEVAKLTLSTVRPRPISIYIPNLRTLPAGGTNNDDLIEDRVDDDDLGDDLEEEYDKYGRPL